MRTGNLPKFGQIARAQHRRCAHEERRIDFCIAVFARVYIQKPVDQCPLQPGRGAFQHVKAAARDFDPPLEVNDVQLFGQVPVGFGGKVEDGRRAPLLHHLIARLVLGHRHIRLRGVGDAQHRILKVRIDYAQFCVQPVDFVADTAHFFLQRVGLGCLLLPHQQANPLRSAVALGAQGLHTGQNLPAAFVQGQGLLPGRGGVVQFAHGLSQRFPVFTHPFDVEH